MDGECHRNGNDTTKVLLSLLGIVIVKCTTNDNRKFVGDLFLGLAVSTMLGDSLLHILPSVLGKSGLTERRAPNDQTSDGQVLTFFNDI